MGWFKVVGIATCATALLLQTEIVRSAPITINFEAFSDLDFVNTQIPGLTFTHAVVLTSGKSVNEQEIPPRSGTHLIMDFVGPMTVSFVAPVISFGAYFTYLTPVQLFAFDDKSNLVDSVASSYFNNQALSGDAGSSPNEFLSLNFAGGISSVSILGNPDGFSFALDDLTFDPRVDAPISAPGTIDLLVLSLLTMIWSMGRSKVVLPR